MGHWLLVCLIVAADFIAAAVGLARAEKTGSWQGSSSHVLEWLQTQKQPGSGMSCCGLGDAVNVRIEGERNGGYLLTVTNGRGNLPDGMQVIAARDRVVRVNFDEHGEAVAWVNRAGTVYCLSVPPQI